MTVEVFDLIKDLNPAYPEGGSLVSEGDDHIRGVKDTLQTQFPNLEVAVTATAAQLNNVVSTAADSKIAGNITFADENYGLQWDLSGSDPVGPVSSGFDAFTAADPYAAGTIYGISLGMPVMIVNANPVPGVTSGFHIYYDSTDTAAISGFEFIAQNLTAPNNKAGGFSIFDNASGQADLSVVAKLGQVYFQDTVANGGAAISLNTLSAGAVAVNAVETAHGALLAYIESLEARIAALEAA